VLNGLEQTVIDLEKTYIVRYADDFLIIGDNALTIRDKAIPKVKTFLNTRSLKINEEKSCMTDISKGFNYLGYHIREYPDVSRIKGTKQGIFLIKPTGENVKKVLRECRSIIKKHENANAGFLIMKINPILRGWAEHYRSVTSSRALNKISRALFIMLWQWIKRKHRNVPKRILSRRYFTKTVTFNPGAKGVNSKEKRVNRWVFFGKNDRGQEITLFQISSQNIKRHSMVSLTKPINPYLLKDQKEFIKRNQRDLNNTALIDNVRKTLLKKQKGVCIHCGEIITSQDKIEIHHVIPIRKGGTDELKNLQALHKECHNQITYSNN
jgi:RNA-directed DNA polymerase